METNREGPLFIDRSPEVFEYIYQHLQGYHVEIPNGEIYTKLYTDSIYFNLPRLKKLLLDDDFYYISMSGECLKVPKKLITTEGNHPNYFSVTFESQYRDLTHVMISKNLLRPPPQASPKLHRDPGLFKDLLKLLQGIELDLSENHRRALIKEARYYRFNSILEKLTCVKIIKKDIFSDEELIIVNLDNVDLKNFVIANIDNELSEERHFKKPRLENFTKRIEYKRKYKVDYDSRELIIEIDSMIKMEDIVFKQNGNLALNFKLPNNIGEKLFEICDFTKLTKLEPDQEGDILANYDSSSYEFQKRLSVSTKDCLIKFDNIDVSFRGKSSQESAINKSIFDTSLLVTKSYWKLDVKISDEKYKVELVPLKLDLVPFNEAEMYNLVL